MNVITVRKYRKRQGALSILIARNPVLVMGLDLPFVIVCGTSLKNAVALSIEMFMIHMVTIVVAMLTVRFLPMWARMLVNVGVSFVVMTVARYFITAIFPDIANYVGMFIYLMAVNGITIFQCSQLTKRHKPWTVLSNAFLGAAAFAIVMLLISLFREYWGVGTLWGIPVAAPLRLSGLLMPFSGFILCAFLLAFTRFLNKKFTIFSIREAVRQDARYVQLGQSEQDYFDFEE